jgi:hypothetical protein
VRAFATNAVAQIETRGAFFAIVATLSAIAAALSAIDAAFFAIAAT